MTIYDPFRVAIVDCETTGLDPDRHEVWEVGILRYDFGADTVLDRHVFQLAIDGSHLDPIALDICGFLERRKRPDELMDPASFSVMFQAMTDGYHWLGAVPSFDEERLRRMLLRYGQTPAWHYHLVDIEALCIGWLRGGSLNHDLPDVVKQHPINSKALSRAMGVDPDQFDAHTAMGDCEWALALYRKVLGYA